MGRKKEKEKAVLEKLPEISNIHHIHTWNLTDREIHFECHADLVNNITISESDKVRMEAYLAFIFLRS